MLCYLRGLKSSYLVEILQVIIFNELLLNIHSCVLYAKVVLGKQQSM